MLTRTNKPPQAPEAPKAPNNLKTMREVPTTLQTVPTGTKMDNSRTHAQNNSQKHAQNRANKRKKRASTANNITKQRQTIPEGTQHSKQPREAPIRKQPQKASKHFQAIFKGTTYRTHSVLKNIKDPISGLNSPLRNWSKVHKRDS